MDTDRVAEIRSTLMSTLDWPVTAGEVTAAAEQADEPLVADAARRLPDDGHWVEIDELWDELAPRIEELERR